MGDHIDINNLPEGVSMIPIEDLKERAVSIISVDEIKQIKHEMEREIRKMIYEFEEKNKVKIKEGIITRQPNTSSLIDVKLTIEI